MPAVVLAMTSVLAVGQAVLGQLFCVDAARAGARAAARGEDDARVRTVSTAAAGSPAAVVSVSRGSQIRVAVRRPVHLLGLGPTLTARGEAVAEPEQLDRGSATVLVLAAVLLAALLAVATGLLGSAVLASHRARAAADLSALAAADAVALHGPTAACGAAQKVAQLNGAAMS